MWPVVMATLRRQAPFITLPFAALVGFIGYHIEGYLSDRYTPYNPSIAQKRAERLAAEIDDHDPTKVEKLILNENVLGRNLSPSLQSHN